MTSELRSCALALMLNHFADRLMRCILMSMKRITSVRVIVALGMQRVM